jgi:hypothetical protein
VNNQPQALPLPFDVRIGKPRKVEGEWVVPVFVNGKRHEGRTYYAADRADAFATFSAMVAEQSARGQS